MVSRIFKLSLFILPCILFVAYVAIGNYNIPFSKLLFLDFDHPYERMVVLNIRLPRAIMASLFGAVMGLCGATVQTVLRNPLASPYILGISSGAAFGAALSMTLPLSAAFYLRQPMAALFGLTAVGMALLIARIQSRLHIHSVILGGVIISALFTGLLSLVQILVAPEQTQAIVSWIIGRLNTISWKDLYIALPVTITLCFLLFLMRWRIFAMSMGDEEAETAGIPVQRDRLIVIVLVSCATAAVVSVCGIIGWVCLLSPHITRFMIGSHTARLLPASVSVGMSFMLLADLLSRTVWRFEIPVGVVTTVIGAPVFLYLMRRNLHVWRG
jgi:iron complex transport system permease protein